MLCSEFLVDCIALDLKNPLFLIETFWEKGWGLVPDVNKKVYALRVLQNLYSSMGEIIDSVYGIDCLRDSLKSLFTDESIAELQGIVSEIPNTSEQIYKEMKDYFSKMGF